MELERLRQHSASQTSLNSLYKSQSQPITTSQSLRQSTPKRPPLRCVQETSAILRSPGPLESMLKTTTETGDIGLFTIKPTVPPATYHQPPRPRPGLADANLLQASRSRFYHDNSHHDDRKRLPSSYRDTTSEILSLYGSDSRHSRTFTPSNDDGRRSYSLTTCSSRHMPSQKSSSTLQSQSCGPGLQRPRSPFPYPTRLRRPGVRPASPALTENGGIDYSRMIQLDRRTIHGSYKPTYNQASRRAPPLSLHNEGNRSTASLPCRSSPGLYYANPSACLPRTPGSYHAGAIRSHGRAWESPKDQSLRSASLTSIVELYQDPTAANSTAPPLQPTGSFYYDYSEEFEDRPPPPPPLHEIPMPFCPVPQRADSLSRPMVLRAEEEGSLEISPERLVEEEYIDNKTCPSTGKQLRRVQSNVQHNGFQKETFVSKPMVPEPASQEQEEASNGSIEVDPSPQDGMIGFLKPSLNACGVDHETVPATEVNNGVQNLTASSSLPSDKFCFEESISYSHKRCRRSNTLGSHELTSRLNSKQTSPSASKKARYTLDPTLSELTSLLTSFDNTDKLLHSTHPASKPAPDEARNLIGSNEAGRFKETETDGPISSPLKTNSLARVDSINSSFIKGHRRNAAAARISTLGMSDTPEPRLEQHISVADDIIISPRPILPVPQLKVKNNVPHLMKALPPLPTEAHIQTSQPQSDLGPNDANTTNRKLQDHSESSRVKQVNDNPSSPTENEVRESPPKLRLRLKPSNFPTSSSESETFLVHEAEHDGPQEKTKTPFQRKLKIKVSRNHAGQLHTRYDGTVLRSPALKQCNSLADLERCAQRDMFASQCHLEGAFSMQESEAVLESSRNLNRRGCYFDSSETPQISDFDLEAPLVAGKTVLDDSSPSTPKPKILRHARSLTSAFEHSGNRGLRQKLSFLRLRIGSTQKEREPKGDVSNVPSEIQEDFREDISTPTMTETTGGHDRQATPSRRPFTTKGRIKRWTRGARKAVRLCIRKTLDRPTNSNSE